MGMVQAWVAHFVTPLTDVSRVRNHTQGMVQAWVAHFVIPLKYTYDEYDWQVMSQKPHKKHKSPTKHHHHGGGAAHPFSGVDWMNPCMPPEGWAALRMFVPIPMPP